jgi:hypothetical protein
MNSKKKKERKKERKLYILFYQEMMGALYSILFYFINI